MEKEEPEQYGRPILGIVALVAMSVISIGLLGGITYMAYEKTHPDPEMRFKAYLHTKEEQQKIEELEDKVAKMVTFPNLTAVQKQHNRKERYVTQINTCCPVEISWQAPIQKRDLFGQLQTLFHGTYWKQYFRYEECSTKSDTCRDCECTQRYLLKTAAVESASGGYELAYFAIPNCCKCMYHG